MHGVREVGNQRGFVPRPPVPHSALTHRGFAAVPGCLLVPAPSLVTWLGPTDTTEKVPIDVGALPCGVPQSNAVGAASHGWDTNTQ